MRALGMVETVGYSTAVFAADAGLKAAEVELRGIERVIGVAGSLGVSIEFEGEVAAVQAAVDAAKEAGERVGRVVAVLVIPRLHEEVSQRVLPLFDLNIKQAGDQDSVGGEVPNDTAAVTAESEQSLQGQGQGETGDIPSNTEQSSTKRRTKHE